MSIDMEEQELQEIDRPVMKGAKWYALKVMGNKERAAVEKIELELKLNRLNSYVNDIFLPIEEVHKIVKGKKTSRQKITMPGYVFIECKLLGELKTIISNVSFVSGWVSDVNGNPNVVRGSEIERMRGRVIESRNSTISYIIDEPVKIVDGPFSTFEGVISMINEKTQSVKVNVKIFGRETSVDLKFYQIERM